MNTTFRTLVPTFCLIAGMSGPLLGGDVPAEFPDLARRVGKVLDDEYYNISRADSGKMVERALRALEQSEISIDTRWDLRPGADGIITIDAAGKIETLLVPDLSGGNAKSSLPAMAVIDQIRARLAKLSGLPNLTPQRIRELDFSLINGALMTMDPHTVLLPPETAKRFNEDIQGEFHGIGAQMNEEDGKILISRVMPGRPAERSGVKDNDAVLAVDGESTTGLRLDEVVKRIRGPKGTTVRLTLSRAKVPAPIEIAVPREIIQVLNTMRWRQGKVGYVIMNEFNQLIADDLLDHVRELQKVGPNGEEPIAALVLDLRLNPGGLLNQAKAMADFFLPARREIVRTEAGNGQVSIVRSSGRKKITLPVVILTSGNTASASEIVAGALQLNNRAVIAGTTTFGKGTVQTSTRLSDQSQLKYLIQEYKLLGGKSIQDVGVAPDLFLRRRAVGEDGHVDVSPIKLERESDRESALANTNPYEHHSELELPWVDVYPTKDELKRSTMMARDFQPNHEAMLIVDLLNKIAAAPDFVTAAAAADEEGQARQFLIERLRAPVAARAEQEELRLAQALAKAPLPATWGDGTAARPGQLHVVPVAVGGWEAGARSQIPFIITNSSTTARGRIYAVVEADQDSPLWEAESVIGQIPAGATKAFSIPFTVPLRALTGSEHFNLSIRQDGQSEALATIPVEVAIAGRPRPHLSYRLTLDKAGAKDRLDPGDDATIILTIRNEGQAETAPIALSVLKDNNQFVSLAGEVTAKLDRLPAGGEAVRRIPMTLAKSYKGVAYDGTPVKLNLRCEEIVPEGDRGLNRAVLFHSARIPVGEAFTAISVHPPELNLDSAMVTGAQVALRYHIAAANLRYVALFHNDEKIDLKTAATLISDGDVRTFAPVVGLKPGLNTLQLIAADTDDAFERLTVRLWQPEIPTNPAVIAGAAVTVPR